MLGPVVGVVGSLAALEVLKAPGLGIHMSYGDGASICEGAFGRECVRLFCTNCWGIGAGAASADSVMLILCSRGEDASLTTHAVNCRFGNKNRGLSSLFWQASAAYVCEG